MKNTLIIAIFTVLALLIIGVSPAPAEVAGKTFINGIDANFPPFAMMGRDGKATGFDIEAVDWIAKKLGFSVKHQPMEWDSIVTSLKDKKIDLIASGLSVSAERANQIAFSKPYWQVDQVVLVRKDSDLTVEQVMSGDLKIGVQQGTSEAKSMADANGKNGRRYTLAAYGSAELAASDVVNGRIAAVVLNDAPAGEVIKHLAVKNIGQAGIPSEEFAYGVNKDNVELLEALNKGLDLLTQDPFWETLKAKYNPGVH
ncbi:MAG: ABC transporter substrate-binding protein [Deltaproteobacteria bacterium]|jgi:polar amino acid transport system substrate-binding protein|nr:ABC transporter substrate-binding protein [Deltaproteobacteria bacterium]